MVFSTFAAAVALPLFGAGVLTATVTSALLTAGPAQAQGMKSGSHRGKSTRVYALPERRQGKSAKGFAKKRASRAIQPRPWVSGYFQLDLD
jgi:hypothetical protein